MFVDASAIVAILTGESEADAMLDAVEAASAPITSAVAIYEAVLAVSRKKQGQLSQARRDVADFLHAAGLRVAPIAGAESEAALDAFAKYGRGRGHPAKLNMGDCFVYAVAKTTGTRLLFKGGDFIHTDIVAALATR